MTAQQFYAWQQLGLFLCAGLGWLVLSNTEFVQSSIGRAIVRITGASWVAYAGLIFLEVFWACDDVPWWVYYGTGCWLN